MTASDCSLAEVRTTEQVSIAASSSRSRVKSMSSTQPKAFWYRWFRGAAYVSAIGSLVWTMMVILPFAPFSYLPPIIAGEGPAT